MDYDFDLGTYSRPLSQHAQAQLWFDRGLIWLFGYNHEEAIACFERALAIDASLALAHWGIAYAVGPNYNKPWIVFTRDEKAPCLARVHAEITQGLGVADVGSVEADLLNALLARYPTDADVDDYQPFHDAYAFEMAGIYQRNMQDLDVVMFYVEALMNRTPWQMWDIYKGTANPESNADAARAALEDVFQRADAWDHPGLLHLYIHLMEMSPTPEAALRHGDRLTNLCPDAGHLVHMSTHIDVLCGDYTNVVARNHRAANADVKFVDQVGAANFYALYRIHNLHFETYGAMFLAQKSTAMAAANRMRAAIPEEVVRLYPDLFEAYVTTRPHVMVRFGMWQDILEEPLPEDRDLYAFTYALLRYTRAVAYANLGQADKADAEARAFEEAYTAMPEKRMLFQNKARDVLNIARAMMYGEIAYKGGDTATGLDHLRDAVKCDDGLMYEEPWAWPQPARHALGALLMDAGDWAEAEAVYRADLGLDPTLPRALQNPQNIWALHGLHECLEHRGEAVEIIHIRQQLDKANARADIVIKASCFCRKGA